MKRFLTGLVIAVCAITSVIRPGITFSAANAPFTFLVYMNGSDLESSENAGSASDDQEEMN